jgi:hypothetical protein
LRVFRTPCCPSRGWRNAARRSITSRPPGTSSLSPPFESRMGRAACWRLGAEELRMAPIPRTRTFHRRHRRAPKGWCRRASARRSCTRSRPFSRPAGQRLICKPRRRRSEIRLTRRRRCVLVVTSKH